MVFAGDRPRPARIRGAASAKAPTRTRWPVTQGKRAAPSHPSPQSSRSIRARYPARIGSVSSDRRTPRFCQNRVGLATIKTFLPLTRTSTDCSLSPSVSRIWRSILPFTAASVTGSGRSLALARLVAAEFRAASRGVPAGGCPRIRPSMPGIRHGAGLGSTRVFSGSSLEVDAGDTVPLHPAGRVIRTTLVRARDRHRAARAQAELKTARLIPARLALVPRPLVEKESSSPMGPVRVAPRRSAPRRRENQTAGMVEESLVGSHSRIAGPGPSRRESPASPALAWD